MDITVNGKTRQVTPLLTISGLIGELELAGRRIAVEVNAEVVPRSAHGTHELRDGDRVEIVHAIGGG